MDDPVELSHTHRRFVDFHDLPNPSEAFQKVRDQGGEIVLLTARGVGASDVREAFALPDGWLRSKSQQASPEAGRGRGGHGLIVSSYTDERFLAHTHDDLQGILLLGAAETAATEPPAAQQVFTLAEVMAIADATTSATAAAISGQFTERSTLVAKGSNIGTGTFDNIRRVLAFETSAEAEERSGHEPRRAAHMSLLQDNGSCTISRAMADACAKHSCTVPITPEHVGSCTRRGIFKEASDIWQHENGVTFTESTKSRKASEFRQTYLLQNSIAQAPPRPRAQVAQVPVSVNVGSIVGGTAGPEAIVKLQVACPSLLSTAKTKEKVDDS